MRRLLPVLALLALVAPACSSEPEAVRGDTGAVESEGAVDPLEISLGDCLSDEVPDQEEVESVPAVPCDEPHTGEVYALFDLPDGDFPGDEAVGTAADQGCVEEFEPFVGIAYEDSRYEFTLLQPTRTTWEQLGDREVVCVVTDPDGPTTGSLEGTRQ